MELKVQYISNFIVCVCVCRIRVVFRVRVIFSIPISRGKSVLFRVTVELSLVE